jgi:hypothetical protein
MASIQGIMNLVCLNETIVMRGRLLIYIEYGILLPFNGGEFIYVGSSPSTMSLAI